jgi:hypothetical protein
MEGFPVCPEDDPIGFRVVQSAIFPRPVELGYALFPVPAHRPSDAK